MLSLDALLQVALVLTVCTIGIPCRVGCSLKVKFRFCGHDFDAWILAEATSLVNLRSSRLPPHRNKAANRPR